MPIDRVATLKSLLEQNPGDNFCRYGLAMEYMKADQYEDAVEQFRTLIGINPDYAAAYYQGGKALEKLGRGAEARTLYEQGVVATTRTGDDHARSELLAALQMVG